MVTERAAYAESGLIRKQTEDHLRAAPIRPVDYVIILIEFQIRVEPRDIYVYSPLAVFSQSGVFCFQNCRRQTLRQQSIV